MCYENVERVALLRQLGYGDYYFCTLSCWLIGIKKSWDVPNCNAILYLVVLALGKEENMIRYDLLVVMEFPQKQVETERITQNNEY